MSASQLSSNKIIAIAGNSNSGKTTLFNFLTGLRHKVGNYPGVTVEKKEGRYQRHGTPLTILDLPGTYALSTRTEEERIAFEILTAQNRRSPPLQGVLCLVDSTALERSLILVLQVLATGNRCALLLNMTDELETRGGQIDHAKLAATLGIPVFPVSARSGTGFDGVEKLMEQWALQPPPHLNANALEWPLEELKKLKDPAKEIVKAVIVRTMSQHGASDKIDAVIMHPLWGPLVFLMVVLLVFQSIFTGAAPLMNLIDTFFSLLKNLTSHLLPDGILRSFISDGILTGVGSVVLFIPQILIVFFYLAVLEHSGYMARAATVMDRFFSKIGLQGKSFLPLMSSYACAVPGIMAARIIENKQDRLATILISPFMTCSARLPVYTLLIGAFIPNTPFLGGLIGLRAMVLLGLYLLGFLAAVFTAFILKSTILKSPSSSFIMDIPPYRWPPLKNILLLMWDRAILFLEQAGTIILGVTMVFWVLASFPRTNGQAPIEKSYAADMGHFIEPIIKPLGFDWKIGIGLLSAQVARETIISTLSTLYQIEDDKSPEGKSLQETLKSKMDPLTGFSLLVFFVFAMQCMSTLAITKRETGSWKVPGVMFLTMNTYAYLASLLVYQGGRFLGF